MNEPIRFKDTWTQPEGYRFPSCRSCGHIYYEMKPVKSDFPVDGGMCHWCIADEANQENEE